MFIENVTGFSISNQNKMCGIMAHLNILYMRNYKQCKM